MSAVARRTTAFDLSGVELMPMRRRHLRSVIRIETEVYPRPWSLSLFMQEIARRRDRVYLVARHDAEVIGYGGLMLTGREAHITTIAVDPILQRRGVGMKIMIGLMDAAIQGNADSVSLEVRKTNAGAQKMYQRFGFRPVGIRKGYYIETGEDAVVMWVEGVDASSYVVQLARLRRENERKHGG